MIFAGPTKVSLWLLCFNGGWILMIADAVDKGIVPKDLNSLENPCS